MRVLTPALLLAVVSVVHAAELYLHPPPPFALPAELSPAQANLVLAHHLRLESFEALGGEGQELHDVYASDQRPFVGAGHGSALLLSVDEEDVRDVIPDDLHAVSLTSPPAPSLLPTYIERAAHTYAELYTALSAPPPSGVPLILNIFSLPPTPASSSFLAQLSPLIDFLDAPTTPSSPKFGAFELSSLRALADYYGTTSEEYLQGKATLRAVISSALSSPDLHLAVLATPLSSPPTHEYEKRAPQQTQAPLPPNSPAEPISAVSGCFSSASACGNATSSCSGHGQCVRATKAGRTCFVCACAASKDEKGRTEEWAGQACERRDVSGPFVLLAGTTLVLVLLVVGSVALLGGVGGQELPSTLTASAVGGSKRD